jgi:ribosomal protein L25 (general stress protein Ctc)
MEKNGVSNVKERLRIMGQNIARTYVRYWKPTETILLSNLKDVITTIYQKILNSAVTIEIDKTEQLIKVQDSKCAPCKYQ